MGEKRVGLGLPSAGHYLLRVHICVCDMRTPPDRPPEPSSPVANETSCAQDMANLRV